jgi:hypothetical protein
MADLTRLAAAFSDVAVTRERLEQALDEHVDALRFAAAVFGVDAGQLADASDRALCAFAARGDA